MQHRLRLWRSCIQPILTYGIFVTGITRAGLHKLQSLMYQMLRQTIGDHAYRTRHTHQEALALFHCPTPLQLLQQVVRTQLRSITQRTSQVPGHDIVLTSSWTTLTQSEALIMTELHLGPAVPVTTDPLEVPSTKPTLKCSRCSFQTDNLANLRRHCTNIHAQTRFRVFPIDWKQDAVNGMPQCSTCLSKFTSWRSFRTHVERRTCQALPKVETRPGPDDLVDHDPAESNHAVSLTPNAQSSEKPDTCLSHHSSDKHLPEGPKLPHTLLNPRDVGGPHCTSLPSFPSESAHRPTSIVSGILPSEHAHVPSTNNNISCTAQPSGEASASRSTEMTEHHDTDANTILSVRLLVGDLAHLNAQPFGEPVLEQIRAFD